MSRPYTTVKIGEKSLVGLLDTGSPISILGNDAHYLFNNITELQNLNNNSKFSTANGQKLKPIGTMELPVSFHDQLYTIQFYVVPEIKSSLILGMDFWRLFNIFPKHLSTINFLDKYTEPIVSNISVCDSNHICCYDDLDENQKAVADSIISEFRNISYEERGLGRTSLITHAIETGDAAPIRQRYYRMSPEKKRILIEQLDEMLKEDVVEPCESC